MPLRRADRTLQHGDSVLSRVARTARRLAQATDQVNAVLPPDLRGRVAVARLTRSTLYLGTDTSSLATRLRFAAPEIVEQLRRLAMFRTLQDVQVRVVAMPVTPPAPTRVDINVPPIAAEHLQALATELIASSTDTANTNRPDTAAARAALGRALADLATLTTASPSRPPDDGNPAES